MSAMGGNMDQRFVVYGTEGILHCPDPNFFGGPVYVGTNAGKMPDFSKGFNGVPDAPMYEIPHMFGYLDESRGVGLMDLAFAVRNGRKPRCHNSMGLQSFEVVHGIIDSCTNNVNHKMVSKVERPKAVASGVNRGLEQQIKFDD